MDLKINVQKTKKMWVRGVNDECLLRSPRESANFDTLHHSSWWNRIFDSNVKSFDRVGNMEGHQRHQDVQLKNTRKPKNKNINKSSAGKVFLHKPKSASNSVILFALKSI
jgi:hypothetical protein